MASTPRRTVVITGGTSGLGYHCAIKIARQKPSYDIILASRTDPNSAAESINKLLGQKNVSFLRLDLSNLVLVRSFVAEFEAGAHPPIEALILNAGSQFPDDVQYTKDGFESTFAINHLGHALLFSLLLPSLSDTARIVVTSSGTHDPAQKSGLPDAHYTTAEDLAHPTPESARNPGRQRYTTSKLANVLWTYALHRRLQQLNADKGRFWTVAAFDPGLMPGTGLLREAGAFTRFIWHRVLPKALPILRFLFSPNTHTPEESGAALSWLATGDDCKGTSGLYYEGKKAINSSNESYVEKKQEDLWSWTVKTIASDPSEQRRFEVVDI
ncbi:Dehydrogenase/reductase SDR family member on chromosome X [Trichoderma lentiforme]|uniref:Dehydrogenase/reductase SDR family member on chromosome X n=1 Tax=Trichoderma lentiforme TaxID=1567552 RepID=A0A9P5C8E5_9HYPO|nr:Dehydrogenase/reductase SDR family member on chromosome X [Trichoderma lentiforme]